MLTVDSTSIAARFLCFFVCCRIRFRKAVFNFQVSFFHFQDFPSSVTAELHAQCQCCTGIFIAKDAVSDETMLTGSSFCRILYFRVFFRYCCNFFSGYACMLVFLCSCAFCVFLFCLLLCRTWYFCRTVWTAPARCSGDVYVCMFPHPLTGRADRTTSFATAYSYSGVGCRTKIGFDTIPP